MAHQGGRRAADLDVGEADGDRNLHERGPRRLACTYTAWSDWDICTTRCGNGTHTRVRKLVGNGTACTAVEAADLNYTEPCNTEPCAPRRWEIPPYAGLKVFVDGIGPHEYGAERLNAVRDAMGGALRRVLARRGDVIRGSVVEPLVESIGIHIRQDLVTRKFGPSSTSSFLFVRFVVQYGFFVDAQTIEGALNEAGGASWLDETKDILANDRRFPQAGAPEVVWKVQLEAVAIDNNILPIDSESELRLRNTIWAAVGISPALVMWSCAMCCKLFWCPKQEDEDLPPEDYDDPNY